MNMAHFEVGGKVICVKTHQNGVVRKGEVYVLLAISKSPCGCKHKLFDIGKRAKDETGSGLWHIECDVCYKKSTSSTCDVHWLSSLRLLPYDDSLSELTAEDILNETHQHT